MKVLVNFVFFATTIVTTVWCNYYYQQYDYNYNMCCAPNNQWLQIPYYQRYNYIHSMQNWPHVQYNYHHRYFNPPLHYYNYNPCRQIPLSCYNVAFYRCCYDCCNRLQCYVIREVDNLPVTTTIETIIPITPALTTTTDRTTPTDISTTTETITTTNEAITTTPKAITTTTDMEGSGSGLFRSDDDDEDDYDARLILF